MQFESIQYLYIFTEENAFENAVCEQSGILSRPQWVIYIYEGFSDVVIKMNQHKNFSGSNGHMHCLVPVHSPKHNMIINQQWSWYWNMNKCIAVSYRYNASPFNTIIHKMQFILQIDNPYNTHILDLWDCFWLFMLIHTCQVCRQEWMSLGQGPRGWSGPRL